ncbi:hypothetical protein Hypma_010436 [Hypsizygus marmoreus]|uniref:Uncharacterized protein n=1 Tax=Hypsizygus marmoreus TaxID=39966 RepID=A0A369K6H1_HYPMA|nr:hypothetical protein Hypma_010436 [Hypsizygus marmoreus]
MAKNVLPYDDPARPTYFVAKDDSVWHVVFPTEDQEKSSGIQVYIVLLGWYSEYYPGATSAQDANDIRNGREFEGEPIGRWRTAQSSLSPVVTGRGHEFEVVGFISLPVQRCSRRRLACCY